MVFAVDLDVFSHVIYLDIIALTYAQHFAWKVDILMYYLYKVSVMKGELGA